MIVYCPLAHGEYIHKCVYTYVHMYIYTYIHTSIHFYIYAYIFIYTYIFIYRLIYKHLCIGEWHPQGWLFKLGVLDFAGGTLKTACL
jgi:hypothetical protein